MMIKQVRLITVLFLAAGGYLNLSARGAETAVGRPSPGAWPAQDPEKTAGQVYRNVQAFKELPAAQLYPAMNFIVGALGVDCAHCHVPNQFEKDDKPAKQTARQMIQMVRAINQGNFGQRNFGDNMAVTCYTCHRGQVKPASIPALTQSAWSPPPTGATTKPPASLPTVDQILDRYIQARGGKAKLERITTLVLKGSEESSDGKNPSAARPVEVYRKAPHKWLMSYPSPGNRSTQAFNGAIGWRQFNGRVMEMGGVDLGMVKRQARLDQDLNLKEQFTKMTVAGTAQVGEHEAYVIAGKPIEGHVGPMPVEMEKLFFDTQTGLLLRRYLEARTALGNMPFATDFEEYREVDGFRWPFTVRLLFPGFSVTQKFTEVKFNLPIDDEKFSKPAAK